MTNGYKKALFWQIKLIPWSLGEKKEEKVSKVGS